MRSEVISCSSRACNFWGGGLFCSGKRRGANTAHSTVDDKTSTKQIIRQTELINNRNLYSTDNSSSRSDRHGHLFDRGRIETPGTCTFNIHSIYLSYYLFIYTLTFIYLFIYFFNIFYRDWNTSYKLVKPLTNLLLV